MKGSQKRPAAFRMRVLSRFHLRYFAGFALGTRPVLRGLAACLLFFGVVACSGDEREPPSGVPAASTFSLPLDTTPIERENPTLTTSYAPVLRKAKAAVVSVHSARVLRVYRNRGMDPGEELLRRFFGLPAPDRGEPEVEERKLPQGMGSGVVIAPDGYILTNNHVISGSKGAPADEILVSLNDGREMSATLVGRDPRSDLAVLKIEAKELPYLRMADSRLLEVGDIVFAVGNPMGVGLTITQGIVSAKGRSQLSILGEGGYENFIQTDAPINPGNSGGALVDAYGRLVGINTAILSRTGGSIGIGFAIPSSFAKHVAEALVEDGVVRRGVLGVNIDDLTPDYVEAFGLDGAEGALIQSVLEGFPADRAGLRRGDVIVAVDGHPVNNAADLRLRVATFPPGARVEVAFIRDGGAQTLDVELADPKNPPGAAEKEILEGVTVRPLDPETRRRSGIGADTAGLVVTAVAPDSPYAEVLVPDLIILSINGQAPPDAATARKLLQRRRTSSLYVLYEGRFYYLAVRPN